ncbi:MAG: AAA family ATPase [Myxococcales bacterium]|nr:AAA family ATPase [Myxococcales bacterium]
MTSLGSSRLLVTAGAGGVGKTTVAAALAVAGALAGKRTAVLTIDPARRLADSLGLGQLTGELRAVDPAIFTRAGLAPGGELWAMMLDVHTTSDQMVKRFAPDAETARAILDNKYYRYFSTSLSGSQEYMAVEQVRALVSDPRFDLVILDTPPASDALDFLDAPDRLVEALDSKAMQMLQTSRGGGLGARILGKGRELIVRSLNTLTGGQFLEDLVEFLAVFGSILDALKEASQAVRVMLRADSTRFLLVTTPTVSHVDEALHFQRTLAERGLPFGGFIANRVHHALPEASDAPAALAALAQDILPDVPLAARVALLQRLVCGQRAHNRMAERDAAALEPLVAARAEPPAEIPLFPLDVRDLAGLARVARFLPLR